MYDRIRYNDHAKREKIPRRVEMNTLRKHWFDIGLSLAVVAGMFLDFNHFSPISLLLWISLITLFLH
jgi:hypothetical protein